MAVSEIKVIDDFLPEEEFNTIQNVMMSSYFKWYYNAITVYDTDQYRNNLNDRGQLTHTFLKEGMEEISDDISILNPMFYKLGVDYLYRAKANMRMRTDTIELSQYHIDPYENCMTSIYYINTNDGYTQFEDGSRIDSVANRMVSFYYNIKHAGTSCTNQKTRVVLNLNYVKQTSN